MAPAWQGLLRWPPNRPLRPFMAFFLIHTEYVHVTGLLLIMVASNGPSASWRVLANDATGDGGVSRIGEGEGVHWNDDSNHNFRLFFHYVID